ncbi:MAG: YMGG-like glycine zipper-containing protein [Pseudomonadota bacterium]
MPGHRSIALLTMLLLTSACATTSDQNATRAQGAGAGAALGAGLGALIGGDPEDILIGAAVGGLAGLAVGEAVARKKANYASAEDMVIEERRIVREKTDQVGVYNAGLERRLGDLDRDVAALQAAIAEGRADHAEKIQLRRRAEADLDQARQRLAEVNQEIDVSRRVYQEALRDSEPVDLVDWDRRIRELERRRDALVVLIGDFEATTRRIA